MEKALTVYNVCIVDDEPYIVHCVADLLSETNFRNASLEIYTVNHSGAALELFARTRIDILITDIEMPDMNGFDLIKRIRREYPLCKTLILTSFPKYEYAVKAVNLGILSYILKTDNDEKIIQGVELAIGQLEQELSKMPSGKDYLHEQKEKWMERIVQDPPTMPSSEISNAIHNIGFNVDLPITLIAVKMISCGDTQFANSRYRIRMLMNHYVSEKMPHCDVMEKGNYLYWLFQADDGCNSHERWILDTLETIQSSYQHISGESVTIAFYSDITNVMEIPKIYAKLRNFLAMQQDECVYCMTQENFHRPEAMDNNLNLETFIHTMREKLEKDETSAFIELLKSTKGYFSGETKSRQEKYLLYGAIVGFMIEYGHKSETRRQNYRDLFPLPDELPDWQDAYVALREAASILYPDIESTPYVTGKLMNKIIKYIAKNRGKTVTLSDLSEATGYNGSYLSHFFASQYGDTLSNYIANERIQYIKELMRDEKKTLNQIAQETAFESRSYFNRFVNRMTGLSPQELRNRCLPSPSNQSIE